jgi:hypothetical protein
VLFQADQRLARQIEIAGHGGVALGGLGSQLEGFLELFPL